MLLRIYKGCALRIYGGFIKTMPRGFIKVILEGYFTNYINNHYILKAVHNISLPWLLFMDISVIPACLKIGFGK